MSLLFIDEVKKYRTEDGGKDVYAEMFEECYAELMSLPKFAELKDRFPATVSAAHDGYFSQDKKGNYKNTSGDTLDDYSTYNTIMRDKEWLLSFDCPLRFIFSHSALKEGWDNPNVFQVCTLIEQKSTFTCRQKVGRGLRLCVNQSGERIEDREINVLHVMANESFAEFAETLQKEIEQETGVRFGVLQIGLFSGLTYTEEHTEEKKVTQSEAKQLIDYMAVMGYLDGDKADETIGQPDTSVETAAAPESKIELPPQLETVKANIIVAIQKGEVKTSEAITAAITQAAYTETVKTEKTVSYDDAKELLDHFEKKGYVSKSGAIKDTMKNALLNGTLDLPARFEAARERFESVISKADRKPPIRDASRDVTVRLNKKAVASPEFLELWDKIKQKTTYRVSVDTTELMRRSVKALREMPPIPKARVVSQTADMDIQAQGVTYTERELRTADIQNSYSVMPDVLAVIAEQTLVKRSTVRDILLESGRLLDLNNNPQLFIEKCVELIRDNRYELAIDGIKYVKLDGEEYYVQEIFDSAELIANLDRNAIAVERSVYDHIIYDSDTVERPFAVALDNDPDVRMFFKIPQRFKVETPIGTYNPDWAVYLDRDGDKKLYFVLETKGTTRLFDLRTPERLKIHCGKRHFAALESGVELQTANNWGEFKVRN